LKRVAALITSLPQIVSCDRVTGDDCFIAKALVSSIAALETLIDRLLPYASTNTSVIQSTPVCHRIPDLG
jgi:Lrp/AsnC family transcriptional regulator, leucine-responsive regulatory protein